MPYYIYLIIQIGLLLLVGWCFIGILNPELMNRLEKDKNKRYTRKSMIARTIYIFAFYICFISFVPVNDGEAEDKMITKTTGEVTSQQNNSGPVEKLIKHDPKDDLNLAKQIITWFEQSGLPIFNVRDTTSDDSKSYTGLNASISSNAVNVMVFDTEQNASNYKSETFNYLNVGRVLLSIKDEINSDSYIKILTEQHPIQGIEIKYVNADAENLIKNLDRYSSYKDFSQQFLKLDPPDRTKIYQTYLYTREFEWEGVVLDRDTIANGLILWCGDKTKKPKYWLDSEGKVVTLSDIVVVELKDDDAKAYIDTGDQIEFKGKMYTIWNKEWGRNWRFIDAEIIK